MTPDPQHTGEAARYIETVGLPGAGKTTYVARLIHASSPKIDLFELPVAPKAAPAAMATVSLAGRTFMRHPSHLLPLMTDRGGRWLITKLGYRIASLARRRPSSGDILLDGGVVQPFVSFLAEYRQSASLRAPLDALWPRLPLPAALLYFRVPTADAYARYIHREAATGKRPGANVSSETFAEAAELCETIAGRFRREGKPVLELNHVDMADDADLIAVARKIADFRHQVSGSQPR